MFYLHWFARADCNNHINPKIPSYKQSQYNTYGNQLKEMTKKSEFPKENSCSDSSACYCIWDPHGPLFWPYHLKQHPWANLMVMDQSGFEYILGPVIVAKIRLSSSRFCLFSCIEFTILQNIHWCWIHKTVTIWVKYWHSWAVLVSSFQVDLHSGVWSFDPMCSIECHHEDHRLFNCMILDYFWSIHITISMCLVHSWKVSSSMIFSFRGGTGDSIFFLAFPGDKYPMVEWWSLMIGSRSLGLWYYENYRRKGEMKWKTSDEIRSAPDLQERRFIPTSYLKLR